MILTSVYFLNSKSTNFYKKQLILQSIQSTNNGKTATIEQQKYTIQLIRQLEQRVSTDYYNTFFQSTSKSLQELNGTWYLQYTSPSAVDSDNDVTDNNNNNNNNNDWKAVNPSEGTSNIETSTDVTFRAQGTVSAAGITLDTANRPTIQSIDVINQYIMNTVQINEQLLPNNIIVRTNAIVGGTFRPYESVPNCAIVSFNTA